MKDVKLGHLVTVNNSNPHRLAKHTYPGVWVQMPDGTTEFLCFTDGVIKSARERTEKNQEDVPSLKEEKEETTIFKASFNFKNFWKFITFQ